MQTVNIMYMISWGIIEGHKCVYTYNYWSISHIRGEKLFADVNKLIVRNNTTHTMKIIIYIIMEIKIVDRGCQRNPFITPFKNITHDQTSIA